MYYYIPITERIYSVFCIVKRIFYRNHKPLNVYAPFFERLWAFFSKNERICSVFYALFKPILAIIVGGLCRSMWVGMLRFRQLLQRIRDIRSSERNFYQQVTDIYATATDYDPRSEMTKTFFATVQNKLHYAVHENTAAEVIYNRVANEKPFVGMTNFKGNYVTKDDVKIAKNYLSEIELQRLNLLVSGFLDFAEFQALEMNPMSMKDWIEALDNQIIAHKRKILGGKGNISHKQAIEKAEKEFEIYRKREMDMLESDFDKEVKRLKDKEQTQ